MLEGQRRGSVLRSHDLRLPKADIVQISDFFVTGPRGAQRPCTCPEKVRQKPIRKTDQQGRSARPIPEPAIHQHAWATFKQTLGVSPPESRTIIHAGRIRQGSGVAKRPGEILKGSKALVAFRMQIREGSAGRIIDPCNLAEALHRRAGIVEYATGNRPENSRAQEHRLLGTRRHHAALPRR
jgi:hypothetical protein